MGEFPDGWREGEWSPLEAVDGRLTVEVDDEDMAIEWSEGRDDHFGRTTRRVSVPVAVVRVLLARLAAEALPPGNEPPDGV